MCHRSIIETVQEWLQPRPALARGAPGQRSRLFLAILLLCMLAACVSPRAGSTTPATLRVAGATGMQPVLRDLAEAYRAAHPEVVIDVQGGGSDIGLRRLESGEVDLAAVSWKSDVLPLPASLQAVPIARDGLAIIVHSANPVSNLTLLQIRAIFRGELMDWAALGGPAGEPMVVSREDGSGDRATFEQLVMGSDSVTLDALVMPSAQAVADYIADHPHAIGYVPLAVAVDRVATATSLAQPPQPWRVVPVEEMSPTPANVSTGAYHLSRLLYLYVPQPVPARSQAFLDFVLSPTGQAIIANRYVSLRATPSRP